MSGRASRSIGEVVELLETEFPDLTISKVRFLESRGLVTPERAPSGYRRYSEQDIAQIRWVLYQQRDRFLPLRVIREHLNGGEFLRAAAEAQGLPPSEPPPPAAPTIDATLPPEVGIELTGRELVERTGLTGEQLAELERFGLLDPTVRRGRPVYHGDDLAAASLVARFLEHGIEARHLRPFKVAAERESGLIDARLSSVPDADVDDVLSELVQLGADLRALLLRRLIHR